MLLSQVSIVDWSIAGADGQTILGTTHLPASRTERGIILCHGFKGYKDYGFFPHLAQAAARCGLIAHRFNFSHSGMTNHLATFERPDLFEHDTWGRQIIDLRRVAEAAFQGKLPGGTAQRGWIWFGHSRGGVTVLLTANQLRDGTLAPTGVITAAAPHQSCSLDPQQRQLLRAQGFLESTSSRTGQALRISREWLEEIESHPQAFDPLQAMAKLSCPILILHGEADETVPISASHLLARANSAHARLLRMPGASHTFNAPNPLPLEATPPTATQQFIQTVCDFAVSVQR